MFSRWITHSNPKANTDRVWAPTKKISNTSLQGKFAKAADVFKSHFRSIWTTTYLIQAKRMSSSAAFTTVVSRACQCPQSSAPSRRESLASHFQRAWTHPSKFLNSNLLHFETAIITYVRSFRIQSLSPLKKRIQELNTNIIKELNESYKEAGIQEAKY